MKHMFSSEMRNLCWKNLRVLKDYTLFYFKLSYLNSDNNKSNLAQHIQNKFKRVFLAKIKAIKNLHRTYNCFFIT